VLIILKNFNFFINKVIKYQDQPVVEDIEKSLMVGELLWPTPTWGGDYKDEIVFGSDLFGYSTVGIPENYTINRLYDRDGGWSHQDLYNQFSIEGVNLFNHLGHSNLGYSMTLHNKDITNYNFKNNGLDRGYVIGYSQGCYCGSFDNKNPTYFEDKDCFAEEFTNFENGAVACIFNSRYGWGSVVNTDGASQYYDRQFFDAIFAEDITVISEANADSKSDNIAFIDNNNGTNRWCAYELNLFGDPSMDIWTAQPTDIIASYSESVQYESNQVAVSAGVAGARIALIQENQLIGRSVADENGDAIVEMFEPVTNTNPITITITGHNKNKYQGTIVVLNNSPYVGLYNYSFNGAPNFGTTVEMNTKFKNYAEIGSGFIAYSTVAYLRSSDEYVTIIDSTVTLGDIESGDSVIVANAFSF
jgi:hypothetical protein